MNRRHHPRPTGTCRRGRRLILFVLALALAGCGGGNDAVVLTGSPSVEVPVAPVTSGPGAAGSGAAGSGATGAGATAAGAAASDRGPAVTTPPTSTGDAPVDIQVGGPSVGIPATLPAPLQSFDEVAVGEESAPRRFRLRSSGGAVEVLALTIEGDGGFALTDDQCTGATLAPGGPGGCALAVVFRPDQAGAASGELVVRLAPAGSGQVAAPARDRAVARLAGHGATAGL